MKRCSRPSTYAVEAATSSSAPTGLAARCSSEIRVPTLVPPSGSADSMAAHVAASHHASSRGVPSTGSDPLPTAIAVSSVGDGEGEVVASMLRSSQRSCGVGDQAGRPAPGDQSRSGDALVAEPLVDPVRRASSRASVDSTIAVAPCARDRSSHRAASAVPTPRPRPSGARRASGTRPRGRRDLVPRRAGRADGHAAEQSSPSSTATHTSASASRRATSRTSLAVEVLGTGEERFVRRDAQRRRQRRARRGWMPAELTILRCRRCCAGRPR